MTEDEADELIERDPEGCLAVLDYIIWRREVGRLGRMLDMVTFGWWARVILGYPDPRWESLLERRE